MRQSPFTYEVQGLRSVAVTSFGDCSPQPISRDQPLKRVPVPKPIRPVAWVTSPGPCPRFPSISVSVCGVTSEFVLGYELVHKRFPARFETIFSGPVVIPKTSTEAPWLSTER
jgi:hypothetical protein